MLILAFTVLASSLVLGVYGLRHAGYELVVSLGMVALCMTSVGLAAAWFYGS